MSWLQLVVYSSTQKVFSFYKIYKFIKFIKFYKIQSGHAVFWDVKMDYSYTQEDTLGLSTRALKTDSLDPNPRSGFNVVARELRHSTQTTRIALLDWISRTVTQHSTQLGSGSRPCGDKVSLNPDLRSASDADPRFRVESPINRIFKSSYPCM